MIVDELTSAVAVRDPRPAAAGAEVARLAAAAAAYADAAQAASTRRAYQTKWRAFSTWCELHRAAPLPAAPDVVALYLTELAPTRSVSTLTVILAAIGDAHGAAGLPRPTSARLADVWAGIRRKHGRPPAQKSALVTADLRKVVARLPPTIAGARDKALLLVCFAGALRRSELVALELADNARRDVLCRCSFVPGGLHIRLGRSKTDQEGRGQLVAIPRGKTRLCPVVALRAWLDVAKISSGPIFREVDRHGRVGSAALSGHAVAGIVKRAALRAGLDPMQFSGHSLRAGFVTSAAQAGVTTELIMRQTRHQKAETVAMYVREAEFFTRNAAAKVGL